MSDIIKKLGKRITGEIKVPGDKSISIRAIIISSIFMGDFNLENFNYSKDTITCLKCMDKLSKYTNAKKTSSKTLILDCENSGTTMRLLTGFISGAFQGMDMKIKLIGDESLTKRPMERIITPLKKMGVDISGTKSGTAPLIINLKNTKIRNLSHKSNIASAQVKSCLELASFCANTKLKYSEPTKSRDHTKIMLDYFKNLSKNHHICNHSHCHCHIYKIPGDTSTASTILTNAIIYPKSNITMKKVLTNPTRIGYINALKKSGINIKITNESTLQDEKVATISYIYKNVKIRPINISKKQVPSMIDEIPLLSLILAKADGISHIDGLSELKTKESNRLKAILQILDILNIKYSLLKDKLTIYGNENLDYKIRKRDLSKHQLESLKSLLNSKDHRVLLIMRILGYNNIKYKKYLHISI